MNLQEFTFYLCGFSFYFVVTFFTLSTCCLYFVQYASCKHCSLWISLLLHNLYCHTLLYMKYDCYVLPLIIWLIYKTILFQCHISAVQFKSCILKESLHYFFLLVKAVLRSRKHNICANYRNVFCTFWHKYLRCFSRWCLILNLWHIDTTLNFTELKLRVFSQALCFSKYFFIDNFMFPSFLTVFTLVLLKVKCCYVHRVISRKHLLQYLCNWSKVYIIFDFYFTFQK